jgi:hypothetical protein
MNFIRFFLITNDLQRKLGSFGNFDLFALTGGLDRMVRSKGVKRGSLAFWSAAPLCRFRTLLLC